MTPTLKVRRLLKVLPTRRHISRRGRTSQTNDSNKDLIIGCFTDYDWTVVQYWANSIEHSGFAGDRVVMVYNTDGDTVDRLNALDFKVCNFNPEEISHGYAYGFPWEHNYAHRFQAYSEYLSSLSDIDDYRYVIATDVKDLVFQSDPSIWLEANLGDKKICASCESLRFHDQPWNNESMRKSYPRLHPRMAFQPIWNCGVQAGDIRVMRDFWLQLSMACAAGLEAADQAAYNVLLSLSPWREITLFAMGEDGWACQAEVTAGPAGIERNRPHLLEPPPTWDGSRSRTSIGKPHVILHQYDRVPEWLESVRRRYASNDPGDARGRPSVLSHEPIELRDELAEARRQQRRWARHARTLERSRTWRLGHLLAAVLRLLTFRQPAPPGGLGDLAASIEEQASRRAPAELAASIDSNRDREQSIPDERERVEVAHPKVDGPLVSVVTIFLDAERFLEEAVESVLAQEYPNWELLLVDDGSSDRSRALAQRFASRHPAIRYLEHPGQENRGKSASRNLGLAHARGKYLAWLDSDDVWFPDTLSRLVSMLEANPQAAMAYGSAEWWRSWEDGGQPDWPDGAGSKVSRPNSLVWPPELATLFLRDGGAVPCPCSVAFRTEAVREVGGFDESLSKVYEDLYEDQMIYSKIFLKKPVFVTDATLSRYRQHPDQSCARADEPTETAARTHFLRWLSGYIDEHGIDDVELRSALDGALRSLPSTDGEPVGTSRPTKLTAARLETGAVDFGDLRRLEPVSRVWGLDRGRPIDRYYVERFLEARSSAIRGRALEIGEPVYTEMFGGGRVTQSEVLDVMGNPDATYACRLEEGDELPADSFDCIVLTQTLQYIYDFRAALQTLHRILKPGGTVLATVPGITRISQEEYKDAWYWSFTGASITGLFNEFFAREALDVEAFGNVLAATGFLYGLADSELAPEELGHHDPDYEVIVGVQAAK